MYWLLPEGSWFCSKPEAASSFESDMYCEPVSDPTEPQSKNACPTLPLQIRSAGDSGPAFSVSAISTGQHPPPCSLLPVENRRPPTTNFKQHANSKHLFCDNSSKAKETLTKIQCNHTFRKTSCSIQKTQNTPVPVLVLVWLLLL